MTNQPTMQARAQEHRFLDGGAQLVWEGKSESPDLLRLYIARSDALTFAMNILRQLEHPPPEAAPLLEIPLLGRLERIPESTGE